MILIYTHTITPRVTYAMDVVFSSALNTMYQLTNDIEYYQTSLLPKIAYTNTNTNFEVFIHAHSLLFETSVKPHNLIGNAEYLDIPIFFSSSSNSFLPYDIFATVFYFVTRYEEYLPQQLDKHQRINAENSLAFKNDILKMPFLNVLIDDFGKKLKEKFTNIELKKRAFNFLSTIDIDNAFAFKNKGVGRNVAGFIKDSLQFNFAKVCSRFISITNEKKDPYNTFDLINTISAQTNTKLHYFTLIGDYATYDKNPYYKNKGFAALLQKLSLNHGMGLHPSYDSYDKPEKIQIEKQRLENSIEKKVTTARCHFLRIKFPDTYRHFVNAGITDDYTMIYASQSGFRTGLCTPFKWFDLEANKPTPLTIHTSCVMEGTLRDYNNYSSEQALELIQKSISDVAYFGGEFISIFHNDTFVKEQQKWTQIYKQMLSEGNRLTIK